MTKPRASRAPSTRPTRLRVLMNNTARAVSAKSHDFDAGGEETSTDYRRMMTIVLDAGYRGWIGIEYEGSTLSEPDGIRATKRLLERVRAELTPRYLGRTSSRGETGSSRR